MGSNPTPSAIYKNALTANKIFDIILIGQIKRKMRFVYAGMVSAASTSAFQADGAGSNPATCSIMIT